ncbi:AhpA/YtjB family protein [Alteromonas sp. ASW11-19]|uniref:AhpA/YtjB family protein n=1 Tax=Alteromonas salexigens TaxID=2982530 RepID=A0ABT2VRJ8_9ALTE|nr:AhpA/YtjB family protein [Alteromonas salexigens]MCU7555750.1 AhpA/YtjB family protein [Alteromonas salexigens]
MPKQQLTSTSYISSDRRQSPAFSHSAYVVMKRLVHSLLLGVTIIVAITTLLEYQQQQQRWLKMQTSQPGQPLARQYSQILAEPLATKDNEALATLLANLQQEPTVIEANVYDDRGMVVAPLEHYTSVVSKAYLSDIPPVTHIQDIVNDSGSTIGYLRVIIDPVVVLGKPLSLQKSRLQILFGCMFLAFILGIYLTRGFYKARPALRQYRTRAAAPAAQFDEKRR